MVARWMDNLWRQSLRLQPGERALILTDQPLSEAGGALRASAQALGARAVHRLLPAPRPLALVERGLLEAVADAAAIVSLESRLDIRSESPWHRAALATFRQAGRGRWAVGAQVDPALLAEALSGDQSEVAAHARRLGAQLAEADRVRMTSAAGTDLTIRLGRRPVHLETGILEEPGAYANLPAGEAYVAPLEDGADGVLVVDVALGDIPLDGPVTLNFQQGRVTGWSGGRAARELADRLGMDPNAWTIGEFGLGANPFVAAGGTVAMAEKALGTAHVALGGNRAFGGANSAAVHYDCVLRSPRLTFES